jgi:inner membrane protein
MDSITQIVLGAACGEAVLGKKIGNKALMFGAIGGTIPDLDVFTSRWIYSNEIDIMAAHRGFSHSILFSVLGAFAFGYLFFWLYNRGKRINSTQRKNWILLFFWALFTHIILDSFTPYGTQLFLPFSEYRVAFNNISVADPTYTVPFLLCMIVMMFFKRNTNRRKLWFKLAVGISSAYMLFTIGNKFHMNTKFKKSLKAEGIDFMRFSTQPTILNNILWYGIAETERDYYIAFYSLLDKASTITNWQTIEKNHHLADLEHSDIKTLKWFSSGYYNFQEIENSSDLQYNDLRYLMVDKSNENQFVFSFTIYEKGDRYDAKPFMGKPPSDDDFKTFINRVRGVK